MKIRFLRKKRLLSYSIPSLTYTVEEPIIIDVNREFRSRNWRIGF